MYIQLTTRCNFSCAHCSQSATAIGEDMTMKVFKKAISLPYKYFMLAGGEPTIHPRFMEMLYYAIMALGNGKVGIVTNGSMKEISLKLAEMTRKGTIIAKLSQDKYHDTIDQSVVNAFTSMGMIQTAEVINKAGRAINIEGVEEACLCANVIVKPNGNMFACGCEVESLGTVFKRVIPRNKALRYCSNRGDVLEQAYQETLHNILDAHIKQIISDEELEVRLMALEYQLLEAKNEAKKYY